MSESERYSERCRAWGTNLIRFCGYLLIVSSALKFMHPSKPVAYMASMGFVGSTLYVVATLELLSAILFLVPRTRRLGLLLVSSYLGGAIAAHLALHHSLTGGKFLVFMATHPYIGALEPTVVLLAGWIGVALCPPEELSWFAKRSERRDRLAPASRRIALGSSA